MELSIGEMMKNMAKIISGIIFLVIGIFIIYQGLTLNLIDLVMFIGLIVCGMGIILLVLSFVDVDPITDKAKSSAQINNPFPFKSTNDNKSPLKVPNNKSSKLNSNINKPLYKKQNIEAPDNEANEVLHVKDYNEGPSFKDEKLFFTPNYEKPVRVTRKPKKRTEPYIDEKLFYQDDKTDEIKKELSKPSPVEPITSAIRNNQPLNREIQIDINNPESLPIPSDVKSFVVSSNGIISSNQAFENLAISAKNDIMVEIPNLTDLDDRFLSYVPITNSRIIIEDFDFSNTSYVLLISSLMRQNVLIRTLPKIDISNLITDNLALIVTENLIDNEGKYGAMYENNSEIAQIKEIFERSWDLAKDIDKNILSV